MSAFVCNQDHIKALAIFAAAKSPGYGGIRVNPRYIDRLEHVDKQSRGLENLTQSELATLYANVLYAENVRSVSERYPDDDVDDLPGPNHKPAQITITNRDCADYALTVPALHILKMCDCLEYQSCETEDYRQTIGFELLDAIRGAAIHALPGYEDAPWEYVAQRKQRAA